MIENSSRKFLLARFLPFHYWLCPTRQIYRHTLWTVWIPLCMMCSSTFPSRSICPVLSGALKIELDILVERLKNEVDIVPIGQIQDRFGSLVEAGYAGQLSELESLWAVKRQLVFPPIEARIDETWQRIVDFFKGHFLPAWRAATALPADTGNQRKTYPS